RSPVSIEFEAIRFQAGRRIPAWKLQQNRDRLLCSPSESRRRTLAFPDFNSAVYNYRFVFRLGMAAGSLHSAHDHYGEFPARIDVWREVRSAGPHESERVDAQSQRRIRAPAQLQGDVCIRTVRSISHILSTVRRIRQSGTPRGTCNSLHISTRAAAK